MRSANLGDQRSLPLKREIVALVETRNYAVWVVRHKGRLKWATTVDRTKPSPHDLRELLERKKRNNQTLDTLARRLGAPSGKRGVTCRLVASGKRVVIASPARSHKTRLPRSDDDWKELYLLVTAMMLEAIVYPAFVAVAALPPKRAKRKRQRKN